MTTPFNCIYFIFHMIQFFVIRVFSIYFLYSKCSKKYVINFLAKPEWYKTRVETNSGFFADRSYVSADWKVHFMGIK